MSDEGASVDEPLLGLKETVDALKATKFAAALPTLKDWITEAGADGSKDHPFVVRWGTHGKPYGIRLSALTAWLERRQQAAEEEAARKREHAAQIQLALGGGETRGEHVVPADIRKKFFDAEIAGNRARRERGELVEAAMVEEADKRRIKFIATFLQGLPDYVARRVEVEAEVVAELVGAVDDFQDRMMRFLMETNFLGPEAGDRILRFLEETDLVDLVAGRAGAPVSVPAAAVVPDAGRDLPAHR